MLRGHCRANVSKTFTNRLAVVRSVQAPLSQQSLRKLRWHTRSRFYWHRDSASRFVSKVPGCVLAVAVEATTSAGAVSASQSSLYTPYRQGTGLVQTRRLSPELRIARSDYETNMST